MPTRCHTWKRSTLASQWKPRAASSSLVFPETKECSPNQMEQCLIQRSWYVEGTLTNPETNIQHLWDLLTHLMGYRISLDGHEHSWGLEDFHTREVQIHFRNWLLLLLKNVRYRQEVDTDVPVFHKNPEKLERFATQAVCPFKKMKINWF